MGAFAGKVRAVFDARESRVVSVPEWEQSFTVFPMTISQLQKIQGETDVFRRAARIIQVRGKNADGSPILNNDDFEELCGYGVGKYGPAVTVRVAAEFMADTPTMEETEKN